MAFINTPHLKRNKRKERENSILIEKRDKIYSNEIDKITH